ncbi:hypothetical protein D3C71_1741530 [compost metagenome]
MISGMPQVARQRLVTFCASAPTSSSCSRPKAENLPETFASNSDCSLHDLMKLPPQVAPSMVSGSGAPQRNALLAVVLS